MLRSLTLCTALALGAMAAGPTNTAEAREGFYARGGIGLGYMSTTVDFMAFEQTLSSMAIPMELLLGGGVTPQLVIGGGFVLDYGPSPTVEQDGTELDLEDTTLYLIDLNLFADYYFAPDSPWHAQVRLGWGGLEASTNGNAGGSDPTGLAITLGAGYDHFLSDQFAVGGMLRFTYGLYSLDDVDYPTSDISLVGSLLYY